MRARQRTLLAAVLSLLPLLTARADEARGPFHPRYQRDSARREAMRTPPAAALPDDLRMAVPESSVAPSRVGGRNDLDERAVQAARWTAEEIAASVGRREYYRAGVHQGLRVALADERLGDWDYLQGVRLGQRDPQARRLGFDVGADAAREAALESAESQVAGQFMDLSREPRPSPRFDVPAWTTRGTWAAPVTLEEVFATTPPRMFPGLGGRLALAFDDWRYDPWGLYRCERHLDVYDAGWKNPDRAFELWLSRRGGRWYLQLGREQRLRFREVFETEFSRRIPFAFQRHLRAGFDEGFADGWNYGAFVSYEWHFRNGYNEGFDLAVAQAAELGFSREYGSAYADAYDAAFRHWETSPKPGIVSVTLLDGNDDGVFEPGETVLVRYEVANYGGRAGGFAADLSGDVLERAARAEVRLPARRVTAGELREFSRIDPRTAAQTRTELSFALGGDERRVPLRVSYPLEFATAPELEHIDALAGTMVVSARVLNASRRGVRGGVTLAEVSGYDRFEQIDLGEIDPGRQRQVTFTVDGLRSLDLLAGRVSVRLEAHDDDRLHDSRAVEAPNLSLDLRDRSLLRFLVALGRNPHAPERDVAEAHRLMLERLRLDWRQAVSGKGNPYKDDRRRGTASTALGELVQTYERERGSLLRPEVFETLQPGIIELSDELPGTHPLLRKHMRRLAKDLG